MAETYTFRNDPLLTKEFASLISKDGTAHWRRSKSMSIGLGLIEGIALLLLIPTLTAVTSGQAAWGASLSVWLGALALCAVIAAIGVYFQTYYGYLAAMDMIANILQRIGNQLARLPLGWFGPKKTGLISRIASAGVMEAGEGIAHFVAPVLRYGVVTIVLLIGTLTWRWQLGLVLAAAIPIAIIFSAVSRWLKNRGDALTQPTSKEASNRIVEFAACQPALRAAGQAAAFAPLLRAIEEDESAQRKSLWYGVVANLVNGVAIQGVIVALIIMAARLGESGALSPIMTVAFIGLALRFTWMLQQLFNHLLAIENARPSLHAMKSIMNAKPLAEYDGKAELSAPGSVEFDRVTFGYEAKTPVVRDVSFTIAPKQMVAIVGPSGSGKTTLFRLISRFWDVDSGAVRVGGVDVREQSTAQLMAQLAMVFQDVYLYDESLIENIRVGNKQASEAEIKHAAQLAGADEIAARLPRGWDSQVGERGGRLSGGERQRVSVARALLKGAPIVLFDEATSALDPENESHIEDSLNALRKQATVVVIAHKLDTVRNADQIVVLNADGEIAQIGTHGELLEKGGLYRDFWDARRQARGWKLASERD